MYIYWELFWSFVKVGAFCVGGGYASMPLIQAEVIENHAWMTMSQFIDIFTISQMTPGPIGINAATFVGQRLQACPVLLLQLWVLFFRLCSLYWHSQNYSLNMAISVRFAVF